MQSQKSSLNKFLIASVVVHLGFFAATAFLEEKVEKVIPVEISFGLGHSRGGSGPKAHAQAPAPKKSSSSVQAPKMTAKTNSPSTITDSAATSQVTNEVSSETPGSGLGTTSGTGSGTTSGAGAGFDDPKIKYRGMIHQLVNSKKRYPRKARALQQEGRVVAEIKLSKEGKLLKVKILETSSYKVLAEATLEAIKGIKKFPEIPSELNLNDITFKIPFDYEIKNGDFI